jgi:CBS domain-containing protein
MESKEKAKEANVGDKQVKEIVEPTISVPSQAKVNVAIDEMAAQKTDSAPVIDEESKLLGTVSKDRLHRKVGGLGHDPKAFPVESEINKKDVFCFSDQKIDEAEELMRKEEVEEVPVVNRDQVLMGKANLEKIEKEKQKSPKAES